MLKAKSEPKTLDQHVESVVKRGRALFCSRKTRDRVVRAMRDKGVKAFSNNHQKVVLHPRHVADFEGEWTNESHEYKREWPALYSIQIV